MFLHDKGVLLDKGSRIKYSGVEFFRFKIKEEKLIIDIEEGPVLIEYRCFEFHHFEREIFTLLQLVIVDNDPLLIDSVFVIEPLILIDGEESLLNNLRVILLLPLVHLTIVQVHFPYTLITSHVHAITYLLLRLHLTLTSSTPSFTFVLVLMHTYL